MKNICRYIYIVSLFVMLGCVASLVLYRERDLSIRGKSVETCKFEGSGGHAVNCILHCEESLQMSKKILMEIADAYRLRQVDVMLEKAKNMPESFFDYVGKTCAKSPYSPLEALYVAEWGAKDAQLPHLDTLPDFEAKIASEVAFARIYGEFLCKSIPYSEVLPELEARMLKRLMGYRSQRMKEGDNEFVKVAEKYLGQWIGHIESAEGFTRTFMHSQRDLLLAGRWRHPEITEESVGASVVGLGLFWLKTECGYMPKWAKAEFPCSGNESPHDEFNSDDLDMSGE